MHVVVKAAYGIDAEKFILPVDLQVEEKLWSVPAPMEKITMGYSAQILYPILSFCVCGALCLQGSI